MTCTLNVTGWPNVEGFSDEAIETTGLAVPTICVTDALSEVKFASPPYTALIRWLPARSDAVLSRALSPESATVPSRLAPSRNVTLPVGVWLAPRTWAVNVTLCSNVEGFSDEPITTADAP